ncbi:TauD/TfdA family dioxygenase [Stenotrophomonas maltophilia]|uniref:TauD/TfdA family dioxygenase n=1 Tax=Stenotrophomonas maltophilia TaxID=40324 RepID=UPI00066A166D|nr:TauD/TfdA family dioxygenase [Stenotrophomonas maltophilia]
MDVIESAADWTAAEIAASEEFHLSLTQSEQDELIAAAQSLKRETPLYTLGKADFAVNCLSSKLKELSWRLEQGIGAVIVDGLDISRLTTEQSEALFWGIGQHLGKPVSQSDHGELMMNIKDVPKESEREDARGVHSRHPLDFHTDLCDVVGMLSLQNAHVGGESMIVSSLAVHNAMAKERPDLLAALYEPVCYAQPRWDSVDEKTLEMRPVFAIEQGRFVSNYLRDFISWAQEDEGAPRLTQTQIEALDYLDALCNSDRFTYKFLLRPGQMLFINNFVTYHSRTGFTDREGARRLLLRLWLSMPDSRPLPESYRTSYRRIGAGEERGGIYAGNVVSIERVGDEIIA